MNLANRLLALLSISPKNIQEKEQLSKVQLVSITSSITSVFFLVLSVVLFITAKPTQGLTMLGTTIILVVIQIFTAKNILVNELRQGFVITSGFALLFLLVTIENTAIGILSFSVLPLITVGVLGHSKGGLFSSFFGVLYLATLFIPFSFLPGLAELPINLKIIGSTIYLLSLIHITLIDFIRVNIHNQLEKQLLDQESTLKLKEDFISNLSHQIRTPLNNIMVVANILENISNDEKQKDLIDTIHASTNNLVNVVNSMVEISNVDIKERGSININFNLYSTINSTIKLFSTQNSNQTAFSLKIDDSIPQSLIGDPVRIKQIFLNLIESILKNRSSSKANVTIKVSKIKEVKDSIELSVEVSSNKPILLPLNEGHNLFITNESTLTSASTQMYIDLLELSITQKLIESNGGKLQIALSAEDAAFSFPYTLNVTTSDTEVVTPKPKPAATHESDLSMDAPISKAVELENANVLLVEDNLINQKIVVLSLKKLVKNIDIANNGKEALDKFGTSRFDIILMDIQMPIMNGIVATKKIREIEASSNSHTPIIAITANALLGDKEECLAAGMDDYISKPFQIEVLIQKMKNLLK
ncbi:MAG: response regulator [Tenuifilaceae bacterium]|jgi:CheY-like chemotaxis protein/signal transduction histidine kinase|nr:response regulator [Tenuifilaceae bacterium]